MTTINEPLVAATGMLSTGPAATTAKIAIAGPGHVGVTLAYACLIRGTGKTIALYGRNAEKVSAEVADLQHGLQVVPMAAVAGSDRHCARRRSTRTPSARGGKSVGRYRQAHPVRSTYKIASTIRRAGQTRGLPRRPGTGAGRYGAITCH